MYVLIFMFICSLVYVFLLAKFSNAEKNLRKIMWAIDAYETEFNDAQEALRLLCATKDFCVVWIRFWDWGYTRILPREDFELVKPYLEEKENDNTR